MVVSDRCCEQQIRQQEKEMIMPKFTDYQSDQEVRDIMERFLERFPGMFEGFDPSKMGFVMTAKKKSKEPIKLHCVPYPLNVFCSHAYVVETFKTWWGRADAKKRNMAVFRTMCSVPDGGFDEMSKHFGKKLQPEIKMYMKEYAACGGVPNWMDNPAAIDPMERTSDEVAEDIPDVKAIPEEEVERVPVTMESIEGVGEE
jgi:hypothetical protein